MYLHLGQNTVVSISDIIGVFDLDNTTGSVITRRFLSDAEKNGRVINVSDDLPRSFIVCDIGGAAGDNRESKVLLSQLSSQTLLKRTEAMKGIMV